ncbi:MAG TPA: alpha/beta hydrolase [Steroidobacteraceae bacterium]|nr:alpha/beta hydrolase [Steroidobacteraceae bacterium]
MALTLFGLTGVPGVGATLGWLRWHQDALVFEAALSRSRPDAPLPPYVRRLTIAGPAGSPLSALLFLADPLHDSGYWVLHLHGNADSAFSAVQVRHCKQLRALGLNVLSFDYRGFGHSPGVASERHMYEDAESAYQALVRRGIAPTHIILWGHSLGSAAAVSVAARERAATLVLFGAFTSIPDVAAATYPYLPVRWVASIHMDSLRQIPNVHIPVIVAHSVADTLVPFQEGARLYAAANPPKRFLALSGPSTDGFGGHVDGLYDHLDLLVPQLAALAHVRIGAESNGTAGMH